MASLLQVDGETLATHHLSPGDEVLFVQGKDTLHLHEAEAQDVLRRAGRTLDLLVAKTERANTPVNVPEPIHLTATPEPEPEPPIDDHDHDGDDDDDDEQDAEEMRRRLLATYLRLHNDKSRRAAQQRVLREDSWWIQDPDRDDEHNVRPTDRDRTLAGGWPAWPLAARRNSDGGREPNPALARSPGGPATLPRRTKSLRARRAPSPPRVAPPTPATAPADIGTDSPFQLQFDEALDIIARCRAQLESRAPSRTTSRASSRAPSRGPTAPVKSQTPDLIDLHTELDVKYVSM